MVKSDPRRPLSEAELDALKALWQGGPQPTSEVRRRLNDGGRQWAYTTTKTILDRLEAKGYVRRDRAATAHVYVPVVSAATFAREHFGVIRRDVFDGAGLPLMHALLEGSLTPAELTELRDHVDDLLRRKGEGS